MTDPSDVSDAPEPNKGPTPRVIRSPHAQLRPEAGGDAGGPYRRADPELDQFDPTVRPSRMTFRGAPAVATLIVVMSLIAIVLEANTAWQFEVIQSFAMSPLQVYAVMEGALPLSELKSVVTHAFLHGGLMHVAFNMMAFAALGPPIERSLGTLVFLPVFVLLAIAGGLAHAGWEWIAFLHIDGSDARSLTTPLVGASGAIFGVLGLDLGRRTRALEAIPPGYRAVTPLRYLGGASASVLIVNIVLMASGLPISGAAHLGGFLLGIALSRVLFRPGGGRVL